MVRVRGIKRFHEPKTGKTYCYHRATSVRIDEPFGSGEFFARLAELDDRARQTAEDAAKPGTLKALILDYKATDAFRDLLPRTRADYERIFVFLEPIWNAPLTALTTPKLVQLRNEWRKTRGRRFVNYCRSVLSILFGHAIELGLMTGNPAHKVRTIRAARDAQPLNRAWTLEERKAALAHLRPV